MTTLTDLLTKMIPEHYELDDIKIKPDSDIFDQIDLYTTASFHSVVNAQNYQGVNVIVPVSSIDDDDWVDTEGNPVPGQEIRESTTIINGRELAGLRQLESGLVVPEWIEKEAGLPHRIYFPPERMYTTPGAMTIADSRYF